MCLAHTSGFLNWRWDDPEQKLRVTRTPGIKYGYSGEGLVYLQVVIEKMTGRSLEELMQQKIFKPLGMLTSSYTWQPAFEKNYSFGHGATGKILEKDKDNEARSASTLETTLDDYTRFTKGVLKNTLLKPSSTREMFSPQIRIRSVQQFGPLRLKDSTTNDKINLSYGLGWVLLQSPHGVGAFKEGHGDGFQHYSIIFPKQGTGIIIMANSDNAESIFKELLQTAIADTFTPWYWENYIPYPHPLKGSNRTSSPALLHQGREGRSTFLISIRQLSKDLSNANGSPLYCVERGRGEGVRDLEIGF
jgi:CubicO group peptidase (beta-lactamase class C family)